MADVYAGYRGLIDIAEVGEVRFQDASITAKQSVEAPDLIMGDWDHDAYVYGKIEVGGSVSGPVTDTFVGGAAAGDGLWGWGVAREAPCGLLTPSDFDLYYYCGGSSNNYRQFTGMYCNTLGFSCTAGEVAQFTMDVMGKYAGAWDVKSGADIPFFTTTEKLITWDKVRVTIGPSVGPGGAALLPAENVNFQSFQFDISNNLQPAYSLSQTNLFPVDIVPGLRTISGTLTTYNIPEADGVDSWDDYTADPLTTLTFTLEGTAATLTISMKVQLHRIEPKSSTGLITSTLGFTGVGHQEGDAWVK